MRPLACVGLLLAAGCAASPSRPAAEPASMAEARPGTPLLGGRLEVASGELAREGACVRYRLVVKNVSGAPVRLKAWVRFLDAEGVEYRKGEARWESRAVAAGESAEMAGVFGMPDPTRLALTVLSD